MKKFISNVLTVCFICYMVLLVYFLFFSEEYGRTASYTSYRINLHLFAEIRRYFAYRDTIGFAYFFINMFGNVIAFMPFGFLLRLCTGSRKKRLFTVDIISELFVCDLHGLYGQSSGGDGAVDHKGRLF